MKFSEYVTEMMVGDKPIMQFTDNDFWVKIRDAKPCHDGEYLVTIDDHSGHRRVAVSHYKKYFYPTENYPCITKEVGCWSNLYAGDKVVAWMPIPAPAKGEARIERKGDRVYYIDENGRKYVIYILAEFGAQTIDRSQLCHRMAVVVEYSNGGSVCGEFYIIGTDDEELLACCKKYVHAI